MERSVMTAIETARALIQHVADTCARPAVLWSGGKDSMAMLHLVRSMGYHWPVICFQESFLAGKWRFAHEVAADWDLDLQVYPPVETWFYERPGHAVLGASWAVGGGETCAVPKDVVEPEGEDLPPGYSCGVAWLSRTTGSVQGAPWDALLCGHKSADTDPVLGAIPLRTDRLPPTHPEGPWTYFPLRSWTDDEVWDYTERLSLPVDWRRYVEPADHGDLYPIRPRSIPSLQNTDVIHACVSCLKCGSGKVYCPIEQGPMDRIQPRRMPSLIRDHFTAENPAG